LATSDIQRLLQCKFKVHITEVGTQFFKRLSITPVQNKKQISEIKSFVCENVFLKIPPIFHSRYR
jgi:hypothetical protein